MNPTKLVNPLMVAVWPGMGGVAISAGYYLMSKLGMSLLSEFEANELFDVDEVEVKAGLIQPGRRPRNRFFVWRDPKQVRDIVVFLGEAQPPLGKYQYCARLLECAKQFGVEQVFTFAAMATQMRPEQPSRVFVAASDEATLEQLKQFETETLESGEISGLNGVLLGAVKEHGLRGGCLLGEIPHVFGHLPFPKASLAVLHVFASLAEIELDFAELTEQAEAIEKHLGAILSQIEQNLGQKVGDEESTFQPEEERLSAAQRRHLEELFGRARDDRAKAFELKQELDRLGAFSEYEDRFLDLFKKTE